MIGNAYALGVPGGGGEGSGFMAVVPLFAMFAIFYFLLIRPQQKKQKKHREMIQNIKKGDRVLTQGGIYGTVMKVKDDTVVLQISEQVRVDVAKSAITALKGHEE